jgi:hypothetical protein
MRVQNEPRDDSYYPHEDDVPPQRVSDVSSEPRGGAPEHVVGVASVPGSTVEADRARAEDARAEDARAEDAPAEEARAERADDLAEEERSEEARAEEERAEEARAEEARVEEARADDFRAEGPPAEEARAEEARAAEARTEEARAEEARAEEARAEEARAEEFPAEEARAEEARAEEARADEAAVAADASRTPAADQGGLLPGQVAAAQVTTLWLEGDAQGFRERWREVQLRFVDDPHGAAQEAEALVNDAVDALTSALRSRREEYAGWHGTGRNDTEELRMAVRRYRELLDRLLAV